MTSIDNFLAAKHTNTPRGWVTSSPGDDIPFSAIYSRELNLLPSFLFGVAHDSVTAGGCSKSGFYQGLKLKNFLLRFTKHPILFFS